MADNSAITKALKEIEANKGVGVVASAMLAPYDTKLDKVENELAKERAVNPLAVRPSGVHVTLTQEKPVVNVIKQLFGF